jgi:hypothetical protein
MDTLTQVRGLRAARLDRILDALAGRAPAVRAPRAPRRRKASAQLPQLGLRFLPTV